MLYDKYLISFENLGLIITDKKKFLVYDIRKPLAFSMIGAVEIFLLKLKIRLEQMLERENRAHIAKSAFEFLPTRIELDFLDWQDIDIFTH